MKAAILKKLPSEKLVVGSIQGPTTSFGSSEMLIRVEACGICGTDLHIMEGKSYKPDLPFVLGHEPVGEVVAVGEAVSRDWQGKRVTMTLFCGCGNCQQCRQGDERLCRNLLSISGVWNRWGGYAEYMVIDERQAVHVPENLSSLQVAALVDAGATAANAVQKALNAGKKETVIIGAGPVGVIAAELLHNESVEPIIVEVNRGRREAAGRLGYRVLGSMDELDFAPEIVIDCAGAPAIPEMSAEIIAPQGLFIAAGYTVIPNFNFAWVSRKEMTLRGVRSGTRDDLVNTIRLLSQGKIRLPEIFTWKLEKINQALNALRAGNVDGKAVIVI
jgi:2-desacetyl-2-hydroxyethyl bacteriochlorophyllide A dehydrogenase